MDTPKTTLHDNNNKLSVLQISTSNSKLLIIIEHAVDVDKPNILTSLVCPGDCQNSWISNAGDLYQVPDIAVFPIHNKWTGLIS